MKKRDELGASIDSGPGNMELNSPEQEEVTR
jgi:hypothetical protein